MLSNNQSGYIKLLHAYMYVDYSFYNVTLPNLSGGEFVMWIVEIYILISNQIICNQ